jgi:DnaJ family protein B protein 12
VEVLGRLVVDPVRINKCIIFSYDCLTLRPVFTATFGPGGFRTTRIPMRQRGDQGQRPQTNDQRSIFIQLLPLIILFAFSIISSLPSIFGSSPVPDPHFSFSPSAQFNVERQTSGLGIKYHVNKQEFSKHPHIAAELASMGDGRTTKGVALGRFEGTVERVYTRDLYNQCQIGLQRKEKRKDVELGFFGIGTDWEKVKQIEGEVVPSCEELKRLGF